MVRDLRSGDRSVFLSMVGDFYPSNTAAYNVDPQRFEATFATAMEKSPFLRALMMKEEGKPARYTLLLFTYSSEADGLVVLIEEVYLGEACRGMGYGHQFLEFLEQEYPSTKRFRLEARKQNENAIRLYQRLGYEILDYLQIVKDAQFTRYFRLSVPPLIRAR